jgi:hypothetical protein
MNKKNLLRGIDYGTITNMEYASYRFGFHVGGTYDVQLSDKFYFPFRKNQAIFPVRATRWNGRVSNWKLWIRTAQGLTKF